MVILGGLVLFSKLYTSRREESTFSGDFVQIDSGTVETILIYPKIENGKEIRITKNGSKWELQNDKIKTAADTNLVQSLLSQFADMKSMSLAGQDKSSWHELQVDDSSGTRIKLITAGKKSYEMVVGKFGYNPTSRNGLSYIRHADEESVYAVEGFLSFGVNQGFNSWRNKTFIQGNSSNWSTLTFNYPADSSFQLSKVNNQWMVNGEPADSAATAAYLNGLANMQATGFADNYKPSSTPVFTLTLSGSNQSPVTILAFPADTIQKFILHSSLNPDAYFSEAESQLADRVFVSKNKFAAKQ